MDMQGTREESFGPHGRANARARSAAGGDHAPCKLLLTTSTPDDKTAWSKARLDVLDILAASGYTPVSMPAGLHPREWLRMRKHLRGRGGHVLIEYPFPQRKRAYMLRLFCLLHGLRMQALIHDLDSLREPEAPQRREIAILRLFDGLVSHNARMSNWLREQGIAAPMVELELFDYCASVDRTWHEEGVSRPLKVLCAGNLAPVKAGYVYDAGLGALQAVELSLYGAFFEPERLPASPVRYKGIFEPDAPALDGRYHFGLVWDGGSVDTCDGGYGTYLRFNNPHKLSLYLALGLPVIVWRESAAAELVLANGVGIAVAGLRELDEVARGLTHASYLELAANAARLGLRVKRGEFLRDALWRLEYATDGIPAARD